MYGSKSTWLLVSSLSHLSKFLLSSRSFKKQHVTAVFGLLFLYFLIFFNFFFGFRMGVAWQKSGAGEDTALRRRKERGLSVLGDRWRGGLVHDGLVLDRLHVL